MPQIYPETSNIYVPQSPYDEEWGLHILDVGKNLTPPDTNYPVGIHPPEYDLNFRKGRVLQEYQMVYITEGSGVFESSSLSRTSIKPGYLIILYPGEWHSYRPLRKTGWKESWIGFSGEAADRIMESAFFSKNEPVLKIGIHSRLSTLYDHIFEECKVENPAYKQVVAGMIMELLGLVQMYKRTINLSNTNIQSQIFQSRRIIDEGISDEIDTKKVAESIGMSYSNFRKHFRELTGFSPAQYVIHMRLRQSKELLFNTNLPIKEIASRCGFKSSYYFVRLFKEKVGITPRSYRLKVRGIIT